MPRKGMKMASCDNKSKYVLSHLGLWRKSRLLALGGEHSCKCLCDSFCWKMPLRHLTTGTVTTSHIISLIHTSWLVNSGSVSRTKITGVLLGSTLHLSHVLIRLGYFLSTTRSVFSMPLNSIHSWDCSHIVIIWPLLYLNKREKFNSWWISFMFMFR